MRTKKILLATIGLLLLSGCKMITESDNDILALENSPVQLHVHRFTTWDKTRQILLIPPLGINNPKVRQEFHSQFYNSAQRFFKNPMTQVKINSEYKPYIEESNLINPDGTLNSNEILLVGKLMNASHVVCPYVSEINPYHPQRISLTIDIFNIRSRTLQAEFSGIFDASESDIRRYFLEFSKEQMSETDTENDLHMKIRSPSFYRSFVTSICFEILADKLPL